MIIIYILLLLLMGNKYLKRNPKPITDTRRSLWLITAYKKGRYNGLKPETMKCNKVESAKAQICWNNVMSRWGHWQAKFNCFGTYEALWKLFEGCTVWLSIQWLDVAAVWRPVNALLGNFCEAAAVVNTLHWQSHCCICPLMSLGFWMERLSLHDGGFALGEWRVKVMFQSMDPIHFARQAVQSNHCHIDVLKCVRI